MIRVLVADDQALVRAGLRLLIDSDSGFEVAGEASDGAQAVELTAAQHPDVVLMDIRMPIMNGLEATRRIGALGLEPPPRVLILTTFDLDEYVFAALRGGASGFLLKDTPPANLLAGIRAIAAGEALLSPSVTRHLIEGVRTPTGTRLPAADRTDRAHQREVEVLTHVARGRSNAEIAETIFVTPATVKTHLSRLLTKLGARDRAQLIVIAYESGLIVAHPPDGRR